MAKKARLTGQQRAREIKEEERRTQKWFGFVETDEDNYLKCGELIHTTYDQLADGGRAKRPAKKIDPETAKAIQLAFDIK